VCAAADSSASACSDQYRGVEAESEAEVRSIARFILTAAGGGAGRFVAFLTYHSYGERILTRWDYTKQILPHDHNDLVRCDYDRIGPAQGGYIFYAGGSLAGAGYCRQCRGRPAILPLQLWQGCQGYVKFPPNDFQE